MTIDAFCGDEYVGHLSYEHDGFVASINVRPAHRRQGVATALVRHMRSATGLEPTFAEGAEDVGNTAEGWAFIQAWIAAHSGRKEPS